MSARPELMAMAEQLTKLRAELARLSDLADRWNTECDAMREDNKRLAAELAELRAQDPAFWTLETHLQQAAKAPFLCRVHPTEDAICTVPIYVRPVSAAQAECTHDCNQGRDCTCQTPPAYHVPAAGKTIAVGKIILGATDGAEVDDWDVEWDHKAIDSINESRPANVNELPLFLATVK